MFSNVTHTNDKTNTIHMTYSSNFVAIRDPCLPGDVCSAQCYDKDLDPKGATYKGCVNTTVSGRTCQVQIFLKFGFFVRPGPPLPPTSHIMPNGMRLRRITVAIRMEVELDHGKGSPENYFSFFGGFCPNEGGGQ